MNCLRDYVSLLIAVFVRAEMTAASYLIIIGLVLHVFIELEVLKPIILQDIMSDGLVLIDLVHELFDVGLIVFFLLEVKDDGASYERSEDGEFILHLF